MDTFYGRTAARFLRAMAVCKGDSMQAEGFVERTNWADKHFVKSAVNAITMGGAPALTNAVGEDFVKLVYPQTIVGRLAGLRRVPLRTMTLLQTQGTRAYWVPEQRRKPVAPGGFTRNPAMEPRKVIALSVITEELARESQAEELIQKDLGDAAVLAVDQSFIDPANAGVADEEPASVTHDAPTIASSGSDADAVRADMMNLFEAFGGDLRTAAFVLNPGTAFSLALMKAQLGDVSFDMAAGTGSMFGVPAVLSDAVPVDTGGAPITLLDANGIELAGATQAKLTTSTEALVFLTDGTGGDPTAPQLVSLWQNDMLALLAEIWANWRVVRPGAVAVLSGANYQG